MLPFAALFSRVPALNEFDFRVKTARNRLPLIVGCLLVVDVDDVNLFHLAPLHTSAIEVGNAVGGQVGHLDTYLVVAGFQHILEVEYKGLNTNN